MKKISLLPLLDYDDREYCAEAEAAYKAQDRYMNHPWYARLSDVWAWAYYVWAWAYYTVVINTFCRWKGHDIVDESYGGPDSGCMAGYCKRCGFSYHETLY